MIPRMQTRHITGIILVMLTVYAALSLAAAGRDLRQAQTMTDELTAELKAAETVNEELRRKISEPMSDEAIGEAARLRLGLAGPGDIIFIYR